MSRLRYIADNPRGPRGGNNDVRTLFASATSARRNVSVERGMHVGRVLIADLDALLLLVPNDEVRVRERAADDFGAEQRRLAQAHTLGVDVGDRRTAALGGVSLKRFRFTYDAAYRVLALVFWTSFVGAFVYSMWRHAL